MDRRLLQRAFQHEYRKRALIISVIVHVIVALSSAFFFVTAVVQEIEDEIQVDFISELPQHVVKKTIPIPKKEEPPKPKAEMPIPKEISIEKKKITLTKKVTTLQPKQEVEIAKIATTKPAGVDIESAAVKQIDTADVPPALETPDFATDAQLTPAPESVLSPIGANDGNTDEKSFGRREGTGVRTPGKGRTGKGLNIRSTGTGTGKRKGIGTGTTGIGEGNETFSSIIQQLADDIIQRSGNAPIDVVFVVDASGSMQDNINAVAEHLGLMIDAYKASEIDYQLGLTDFFVDRSGTQKITVSPLTKSLQTYKQMLYAIIPTGDENALDAIHQTVTEMQFRNNTVKHFILVTDEPFTSLLGFSVNNTINLCKQNEIYVNVLGLNIPEHKRLATETDGTFHEVPQDPKTQHIAQQPKTVQDIGQKILREAANLPTDIVIFVDTSKSMADKMPYITEQIDMWLRDWDNALIDYRVGIVRFRANGTVNMVNVYNPPQTHKQIHKILELPTQEDENLFHAVIEATSRIKTRANAKTHFILFTDEPGNPKQPIAGTISMLKEKPVVVSVIGTIDTFQQQVAQQTGGLWVAMPNAHKVNKHYR